MFSLPKPATLALVSFLALSASAQEEDMLKGLEDSVQKEYVSAAFKSSRVIMSHSTELLKAGVLDFRILHRFGNVNSGVENFFGLDQATIRLGLDYGISDRFNIGIGRGSFQKEIDGFLKYRIVQQSTGQKSFPFSLVAVAGMTLRTGQLATANKPTFSDRIAYYYQAVAGRKFNERLSLQLMPTVLHRNLVQSDRDAQDLFATGIGGRLKVSKRVSINVDYYYVFNQNETLNLYNPLSVGVDIETGGHVFQLHLTNAAGMNERAFLTQTTNSWGRGDIQFGFNISRSFQLKKRNPQTP